MPAMTDRSQRRTRWRHATAACPASTRGRAALPCVRVLLLALALPFHPAVAHVRLLHSAPSAGSRLAISPTELTLSFSERVPVALFRVTLLDATNHAMELGAPRVAPEDATTLTATLLGALRPGRYLVRWEAGGADGHPVRGEFSFDLVADTAGQSPRAVGPPRPQASAPSAFGVRSPGYVAIRAVQSVALVILLGLLALHLLVLPRFARQTETDGRAIIAVIDHASNRWASAMLTAIGIATIARLVAQHAAFFGAATPWSRPSLGALLWNSSWGYAWWLALGATGAGFLGTRWISRAQAQGWLVLGGAALALVASIAMSGHAAAGTTLAMAVHALHVLGAGGWIGSLAAIMLIAVPIVLRSSGSNRHTMVATLVRAFSPTAQAFAGLLVITGAIAAWRTIDTVAELWRSPYGQVLLAKLAVLSLVAGTGAVNWKFVLPSLGSAAATIRLRRFATIELATAILVLVVTAVLVATPLPAEMLAGVTR